jgi:mRNA interferase MazF
MKLVDLRRGSVVLVAFPFTDLTATKIRPALVLSTPDLHRARGDVILAAISSVHRGRAKEPTAVLLAKDSEAFAGSGLRVTSVVDCSKLVTVQGTLVLRRLGGLGIVAMRRVDGALRRAVGVR